MSRSPIEPVGIKKVGNSQIAIQWADDHASEFTAPYLRGRCPCASCVDEWSGERRIVADSFPMDLTISKADLVGRYALQFAFGDRHDTGIYTFEYLRKLCPCQDCQNLRNRVPPR